MTSSIEPVSASELRARMKELRNDLEVTGRDYHAAKRAGHADRVILLLRRRSTLIRELFETQSALLLSLRAAAPNVESSGDQWNGDRVQAPN